MVGIFAVRRTYQRSELLELYWYKEEMISYVRQAMERRTESEWAFNKRDL